MDVKQESQKRVGMIRYPDGNNFDTKCSAQITNDFCYHSSDNLHKSPIKWSRLQFIYTSLNDANVDTEIY